VHARRAVDLAPRDAAVRATLALSLDWSGDPEGAAAEARRSIDLDPDLADSHAYLAETYIDRYQLAEAQRESDRALTLDAAAVEPLRVHAYLLEAQGRYQQAIAAYQDAIKATPKFAHLYFALGNVYRAVGQIDDAATSFHQALTLAPNDARSLTGLAQGYMGQGDYSAAISYLQDAVQADPSYSTAQGQLGSAYYFAGDLADAQQPLEQAIQLEKNADRLTTYHHVLGWVYLGLSRIDQAESEFQAALAVNPKMEGAQQGLAAVRAAR
jgi:tetratricopeptide (TPR) repeat protein